MSRLGRSADDSLDVKLRMYVTWLIASSVSGLVDCLRGYYRLPVVMQLAATSVCYSAVKLRCVMQLPRDLPP